jgi:hypothetical protein
MIGVEILNKNVKIASLNLMSYEIKDAPNIKELINLIEQAINWPDKLIELELWTSLAYISSKINQTETLKYCHSKSLECLSYFEKKKTENRELYKNSQLLLCQACIALGEHLANLLGSNANLNSLNIHMSKSKEQQNNLAVASATSFQDVRVALRREALNSFSDSCSYAAQAENYELAIHSARHYWNLCLPYLLQVQERAYLFDNLREILRSLYVTYKYKPKLPKSQVLNDFLGAQLKGKEEQDNNKKTQDSKVKSQQKSTNKSESKDSKKTTAKKEEIDVTKTLQPEEKTQQPQDDPLADSYDDLTLRCVLYACLFQILIDKQQFEEALEAMEISLNELPRTKHRLLIYRFKVITKSRLGLDVAMDLRKFREESEKNLAEMYRKVALSSLKHSDTIQLYQKAIETINVFFFK